jgi:Ricin-type beta-trefoil lectin domain
MSDERLGGIVASRGVRWLGVVVAGAVLALIQMGGPASAATMSAAGGTTIGPFQINAVGHPDLCWESTGNGGPVALAACDSAIQDQQWSLTPDGVLMNGIGYCLEALTGQPHGVPLYIDFADQCAGDRGQVWQYNGRTGQLSNAGGSICAGLEGSVVSGAQIERLTCRNDPRWSIGYGAVTLQPGTGGGPVGGTFSASVTVANAASAQMAYGVTVRLAVPRALTLTGLHGTGGAAGLACDLRTATCTGNLPSGASGPIAVAGRVPGDVRPGASYPMSADVSVGGTSQQPGTVRTTASLRVAVHAAPPAAAGADQRGSQSIVSSPLIAVVAGILVLGTALLVTAARRKQHPAKRRGRHVASKALQPPTPSPSDVPLRRKRREPVR